MRELFLITKNAATCTVIGDDASNSQNIGVTVTQLDNGNVTINITIDADGILMLMLDKNDASKLTSAIGEIILRDEVLQ